MRNLIVLIASVLFTSCATQQKCAMKFPCDVKDSVSYVEKLVLVHDTVFVPYEEVSIEFDLGDTTINTVKKATKGKLTGTVNIQKGKAKFTCLQDSLQKVIDRMEVEKSTNKTKSSIQIKTEYVNHWYDKPSYALSIVFLMLIALWVGSKLV